MATNHIDQIVGVGERMATAAELSGTHKGEFTLPSYIAANPIVPTGTKFKLLHYTIARWQNGQIVGL